MKLSRLSPVSTSARLKQQHHRSSQQSDSCLSGCSDVLLSPEETSTSSASLRRCSVEDRGLTDALSGADTGERGKRRSQAGPISRLSAQSATTQLLLLPAATVDIYTISNNTRRKKVRTRERQTIAIPRYQTSGKGRRCRLTSSCD